ncbi:tetratricopeptide (TPR) repeat protein [Elusimicrobium simillimum]|uniref:tetratricopeptide repeat protein n=1 Tax=Elusimicrobium simillimum TaxID=3143438 RepID=UPI003C6FAF00
MAKKHLKKETVNHFEHDYITGLLVKLYRVFTAHKKVILTCVLVIAIVGGGFGICTWRHHVKQENSWKELYMAVMFGDINSLDLVSEKFPKSSAALYAQYYKADRLFSEGDYAAAVPLFTEVAASKNIDMAAAAQLSLAVSYQAMENYEQSVKAANEFITKYPNHFAVAQAYLTLALSQELSGLKQPAIDNYKILEARYSGTYFGTFAVNKLKELVK